MHLRFPHSCVTLKLARPAAIGRWGSEIKEKQNWLTEMYWMMKSEWGDTIRQSVSVKNERTIEIVPQNSYAMQC
jgi:hypothetical protein